MYFLKLLFVIFLTQVSLDANPSDFQTFKQRYFPKSSATLPPTATTLSEYQSLSEVEKYLYLESYFTSSSKGGGQVDSILINALPSEFNTLTQKLDLGIIQYLPDHNLYEVSIPSFYSSQEFLDKLQEASPYIDIEENLPLKLFNTSSGGQTPWQALDWPRYNAQIQKLFPTKNRQVTIGILDTGMSPHFDLGSDALLKNDKNGHGTHVAGIINAIQKNNRGIEGISPTSKIKVYKVLDQDNSGSVMDLISALIQAKRDQCDILNMSLGTYQNSKILYNIITKLSKQNILMIAAAGNDHTSNPVLPASHPAVIGVGSYSNPIQLSSFSNFGENSVISLPGENILSTHLNNKIFAMSGTSMAAPLLTGLMAEIYSSMAGSPSLDDILDAFQTHQVNSNTKYRVHHAPIDLPTLLKALGPVDYNMKVKLGLIKAVEKK
ncbi:MAG: S8 family serine peptidase [Candidatus Cloacimonetes bacterium]|nr:S8 family serine peptidase [Candidatus Cloacimonadota bacterium]